MNNNNTHFSEAEFSVLERLSSIGKRHLRELASECKIPASTAFKACVKLESEGALCSERKKNTKVFAINYSSPIANRLLGIISIKKITNSKAFKSLKGLGFKGIFLYGSAANGKSGIESDIDLCVFSEKPLNSLKISEIKRELSKELEKEVQLIAVSKESFKKLSQQNNELIDRIRKQGVVLHGEMF